ncbi:DNA-binding protein [Paenibacillus pinisoli]|uniref:DNA-binding protein n=1 Tax=Paenibacillus pinisoli TaxID=1276110 RepID=A0A3A6PB45_9BACL|nr:DNA-binding protein [Paenibacillus pinisoli]RJX37607.1 DNA-binding protein [Paenibacillus pinisoli]
MPSEQSSASGFPKLAKPALRALAHAGYTGLSQLSGESEAELMKLHGMGPNAMAVIKQALAEQGMSLQP